MASSNPRRWELETEVVHAGRPRSETDFTPTVGPIHHAVTYRYHAMEPLDEILAGERDGWVYARYGSPTVAAFEEAMAILEGGEAALAFASGMAAIQGTLLALGVRAGTSVVAAQDLYGATYSLLHDLMRSLGVSVHFLDAGEIDAVEAACAEVRPAVVLAETLSNPLLKVADVPALADAAHAVGAKLLVDGTFTTPALLQPLALGADVVVHSATKYLAGHGDVLGGVIVSSEEVREQALEVLKLTGGNLGPETAWLALRGLRTLALRMRQHCNNALEVARWLERHPRISRVYYPGLPSHPQHGLASRLLGSSGSGGIVSFEIKGAAQREVFKFFEALSLGIPGTTLGDVQTLLLYPAHASHRSLSAEERAQVGIGDGLVRISVGIEAVEDIVADLDQGLASIG